MDLCALLCELSRTFCVWLLLLGGWSSHPHDLEISKNRICDFFRVPPTCMHVRQDRAGFVRHKEGITMICSLLHLDYFEASYAPKKLKLRGNSQLFHARRIAMLPFCLCVQRKDIAWFHYCLSRAVVSQLAVGLPGRREDGGSSPLWCRMFCMNLPYSYCTPTHFSQLFLLSFPKTAHHFDVIHRGWRPPPRESILSLLLACPAW